MKRFVLVSVLALFVSSLAFAQWTEYPYSPGGTAGQKKFTGDVITLLESNLTHPTHADGFVDKGDPCYDSNIIGVANISASAATDYISVDTQGVWNLNVMAYDGIGTNNVAIGDSLYCSAAGILSKNPSGIFFGYALNTATASLTTVHVINVRLAGLQAENQSRSDIWVSTMGDDDTGNGTKGRPYLTVTQGFAAVTATRQMVRVEPGTYTETTTLTWPAFSGTSLIGEEGLWSTVIGVAAGDEVVDFTSGVLSSTFEMRIMNIQFDHDSAGLDGLVINNTSATKKINLYLQRVGFEADSSTDRSILVTHGDTGNAVRIYANSENGGVGGRIEYTAHNNGDRLYFRNMEMDGGIVMGATAVAADLQLRRCRVLHEGVTGGGANQLLTSIACWTDDSGTLAPFDTADFAGTGTENIMAFD